MIKQKQFNNIDELNDFLDSVAYSYNDVTEILTEVEIDVISVQEKEDKLIMFYWQNTRMTGLG